MVSGRVSEIDAILLDFEETVGLFRYNHLLVSYQLKIVF